MTDSAGVTHNAASELKKLIVAYMRADIGVLRPTWLTKLSGVTATKPNRKVIAGPDVVRRRAKARRSLLRPAGHFETLAQFFASGFSAPLRIPADVSPIPIVPAAGPGQPTITPWALRAKFPTNWASSLSARRPPSKPLPSRRNPPRPGRTPSPPRRRPPATIGPIDELDLDDSTKKAPQRLLAS